MDNKNANIEKSILFKEKGKFPDKPLNYFDFIEHLKLCKRNNKTGRFPTINIGQYEISLQVRSPKNKYSDKNTLADYTEYVLSVIDDNGIIDLCNDKRFINIPYKHMYFSSIKEKDSTTINIDHLFQILSYIEQMDIDEDSYRNKKYFIKIEPEIVSVTLVPATDIEVNEFIKIRKMNQLDLVLEKYVGLYEDDSCYYFIVRREYKEEGLLSYHALYPKDLHDLCNTTMQHDWFTLTTKNQLFKNWPMELYPNKKNWFNDNILHAFINTWKYLPQYGGNINIYKKDFKTWINNLWGKYFDCSAYPPDLDNWINMQNKLPLALEITPHGRVRELYGNIDCLNRYLSIPITKNLLAIHFDRRYYALFSDTKTKNNINKYFTKKHRITGSAIVICEENQTLMNINGDDIKCLFDEYHLHEDLKLQLRRHIYNILFNEDYRDKEKAFAKMDENQKTIYRAKNQNMPDGIFMIMRLNERSKLRKEELIDYFEAYSEESNEIIEYWIRRSKDLLNSNLYEIADTSLKAGSADKNGNKEQYEILFKKYLDLFAALKRNNPGFSEDTYYDALHIGFQSAMW